MKTENKQYKLKRWYPTLPNDWKTEHDYVYYKEESLMVNKLLMTTHIINFKHLEYRDFWEEVEMVESLKRQTVSVECPSCGGKLEYVDYDVLLLSNPPQRRVKCTNCPHTGFVLA